MKTRDKRLTFTMEEVQQIATAAAIKGMNAKAFMEQSVRAATFNILSKNLKNAFLERTSK